MTVSSLLVSVFLLGVGSAYLNAPFTGTFFPTGVICPVHLPAGASTNQWPGNFCLMSNVPAPQNWAPVLYNPGGGQLGGATSSLGPVFVADTGAITLSGMGMLALATPGLPYTIGYFTPVIGHAYVASTFQPDSLAATFAFTVNAVNSDFSVNLSLGVFSAVISQHISGSPTNLQLGILIVLS